MMIDNTPLVQCYTDLKRKLPDLSPDILMQAAIAVYNKTQDAQFNSSVGDKRSFVKPQSPVQRSSPSIVSKPLLKTPVLNQQPNRIWNKNIQQQWNDTIRTSGIRGVDYVTECDNCGGEDCDKYDGCCNDYFSD